MRRASFLLALASGCYVGPLLEPAGIDASTGRTEGPDESSSESSGVVPEGSTTMQVESTSSSGPPPSTSTSSSSSTSTGVTESTGVVADWDPIVADGDRLYFVGNSYTGNEGGLPEHIEAAWPSAGAPLSVETAATYYWGQGLGSMFTTAVVTAIETGNYDSCVVTSGSLGEMLQFVPLVEQSCGHFVVYMTWAINPTVGSMADYHDGTASIVATMRELEETTDVRVIPSGLVFYDLIANPPRDDLREDWLYFPQNIHQNGVGTAVNVYVAYAALVGESPVGIDYDLVYPWDGTIIVQDEMVVTRRTTDGAYLYDEIVFDEAFRTDLQQRAWEVTAAWFAGTTEFD